MSKATLDEEQIAAAKLADWRAMGGALHTRFRTKNFATGLQLVNGIGAAAEEANHHPDLDLRYPHLNIRLSSHDAGGITERDVALARKISGLAAASGATAETSSVSVIDLALETPDHSRIKPFWRAVLGYRDNPDADDEVGDDAGSAPILWFQASGGDEPRQRFHLDVRVPPEV